MKKVWTEDLNGGRGYSTNALLQFGGGAASPNWRKALVYLSTFRVRHFFRRLRLLKIGYAEMYFRFLRLNVLMPYVLNALVHFWAAKPHQKMNQHVKYLST